MINAVQMSTDAYQGFSSKQIQTAAAQMAEKEGGVQLTDYVLDVAETIGEDYDSRMAMQLSLYGQGLDLAEGMAKEMVNMADAAGAYGANGKGSVPVGGTFNALG